MICIFCGLEHDSVLYMCEVRQAAMIRRVVLLTTQIKVPTQKTIPQMYHRQLKRPIFIENERPIIVLDSDEEATIPPLEQIGPKNDSSETVSHYQPTSTRCEFNTGVGAASYITVTFTICSCITQIRI